MLADRYEIEARLGDGAMGVVDRARHVKIGRPFATKVLHPSLTPNAKVLRHFTRGSRYDASPRIQPSESHPDHDPERERDPAQLAASSRPRVAIVVTTVVLALLLWLGLGGRTQQANEHDVRDRSVLVSVVELRPVTTGPLPTTRRPRPPAGLPAGSAIPERDAPTAAEVANFYGALGRELKALEASKGMDSTIDLWPRYRWIRINDWLTTAERRTHVARLLERLRFDIRASR